MRYVIVKLTRSEASERVSEFAPWEVPILSLIHGDELVQIVGEKDYPKREYPDAGSEYERLENRYKSPEGTDVSYCRSVYGIGPSGLQKAIDEARAEAESRDAIPFEPVRPMDIANRSYLAAEAKQLEADRKALAAEREQAQKEVEAQAQAERDSIAAERAALEAERAQIAKDREAVAKEREEVASLLDAATADKPAGEKPASTGKKAATPAAKPISE